MREGEDLFGRELLERDVETNVLNFLVRAKGQFAWKNPQAGYFDARLKKFRRHSSPFAINGVSDIIWIYRGYFIGLEVKRPRTGRQSPDQIEFERRCKVAGGFYFVVRSLDDVRGVYQLVTNSIDSWYSQKGGE